VRVPPASVHRALLQTEEPVDPLHSENDNAALTVGLRLELQDRYDAGVIGAVRRDQTGPLDGADYYRPAHEDQVDALKGTAGEVNGGAGRWSSRNSGRCAVHHPSPVLRFGPGRCMKPILLAVLSAFVLVAYAGASITALERQRRSHISK
jgi:hypothetical protein